MKIVTDVILALWCQGWYYLSPILSSNDLVYTQGSGLCKIENGRFWSDHSIYDDHQEELKLKMLQEVSKMCKIFYSLLFFGSIENTVGTKYLLYLHFHCSFIECLTNIILFKTFQK